MGKERPRCKEDKEASGYLIGLWLTDQCNLMCDYCFQDTPRSNNRMSDEVLDKTIEFINGFDVQGVAFFGGEPLMAKKKMKRVLAQTNVRKYYLTTNGTLLDDDMFDWLEMHKVHLNLSLDGMKDTQDRWRNNSYDRIIANLPKILRHIDLVGGQVLMTCVMELQLFRNVSHIKELGFPSVYINQLDPYGTRVRNELEKVKIFKEQYRKVIALDGKTFEVSDFRRWKQILGFKKSGTCGFHAKGLGISPTGKFSPCHRGPELPDIFTFGDVFSGIDYEVMKVVRNFASHPSACAACDIGFNQCPISCYHEHGKFGITPHETHCAYERAKTEVIQEFISYTGEARIRPLTINPDVTRDVQLIIGTLIDPHKYYLLPTFLKHLNEMEFPPNTDYYFILDQEDHKTYKLLSSWKDGHFEFAPLREHLTRAIRTLRIETFVEDNFMDRITRGRNLLLNQALKGNYTHLMWLDSDIITRPDTVEKLLAVNNGIAGGLVRTRDEGTRDTWFNTYIDRRSEGKGFPSKTDFQEGDIISVDATGCDCVLIRRDVLKAVGKYEYRKSDHPEGPAGEDMLFCLKAQKLGFGKVRIHTGVTTRHVGISDVELKSDCDIECMARCMASDMIVGHDGISLKELKGEDASTYKGA